MVKFQIIMTKIVELASEHESDLQDTADWDRSALLVSMLEKLNCFHLMVRITLVLLMWKYMGLFLRKKNHLYPSKLDCGSYIISIA